MSRDPNRIDDVLRRIGVAWKRNPDLRLGQIVMNVCERVNPTTYWVEDEDLVRRIEKSYLPKGEGGTP